MWKRRPSPSSELTSESNRGVSRPDDPRSALPGLGVGAQVYVRAQQPPADDDWEDEPTGIIIAPGDRSLRNVSLPVDGLTTWVVSFTEPAMRRDGRGPYETAVVPASLLVPAEPVANPEDEEGHG